MEARGSLPSHSVADESDHPPVIVDTYRKLIDEMKPIVLQAKELLNTNDESLVPDVLEALGIIPKQVEKLDQLMFALLRERQDTRNENEKVQRLEAGLLTQQKDLETNKQTIEAEHDKVFGFNARLENAASSNESLGERVQAALTLIQKLDQSTSQATQNIRSSHAAISKKTSEAVDSVRDHLENSSTLLKELDERFEIHKKHREQLSQKTSEAINSVIDHVRSSSKLLEELDKRFEIQKQDREQLDQKALENISLVSETVSTLGEDILGALTVVRERVHEQFEKQQKTADDDHRELVKELSNISKKIDSQSTRQNDQAIKHLEVVSAISEKLDTNFSTVATKMDTQFMEHSDRATKHHNALVYTSDKLSRKLSGVSTKLDTQSKGHSDEATKNLEAVSGISEKLDSQFDEARKRHNQTLQAISLRPSLEQQIASSQVAQQSAIERHSTILDKFGEVSKKIDSIEDDRSALNRYYQTSKSLKTLTDTVFTSYDHQVAVAEETEQGAAARHEILVSELWKSAQKHNHDTAELTKNMNEIKKSLQEDKTTITSETQRLSGLISESNQEMLLLKNNLSEGFSTVNNSLQELTHRQAEDHRGFVQLQNSVSGLEKPKSDEILEKMSTFFSSVTNTLSEMTNTVSEMKRDVASLTSRMDATETKMLNSIQEMRTSIESLSRDSGLQAASLKRRASVLDDNAERPRKQMPHDLDAHDDDDGDEGQTQGSSLATPSAARQGFQTQESSLATPSVARQEVQTQGSSLATPSTAMQGVPHSEVPTNETMGIASGPNASSIQSILNKIGRLPDWTRENDELFVALLCEKRLFGDQEKWSFEKMSARLDRHVTGLIMTPGKGVQKVSFPSHHVCMMAFLRPGGRAIQKNNNALLTRNKCPYHGVDKFWAKEPLCVYLTFAQGVSAESISREDGQIRWIVHKRPTE